MNPTDKINPLYNLSNFRFQNVEITTDKNETIFGQFVNFYVQKDIVKKVYPSDSYCFVQKINSREFWELYNSVHGVFEEFPEQVMIFKQHEIIKIVIYPILG